MESGCRPVTQPLIYLHRDWAPPQPFISKSAVYRWYRTWEIFIAEGVKSPCVAKCAAACCLLKVNSVAACCGLHVLLTQLLILNCSPLISPRHTHTHTSFQRPRIYIFYLFPLYFKTSVFGCLSKNCHASAYFFILIVFNPPYRQRYRKTWPSLAYFKTVWLRLLSFPHWSRAFPLLQRMLFHLQPLEQVEE